MPTLTPWQINLLPWYVFAAYWTMTSLRVKRTKTTETPRERATTIVPMVIAFLLLFSDRLAVDPLSWRFAPADFLWTSAGIFLTSLGVAVSLWARYCLGQYWSARVTLKEGHRLIQSGPYAYVRHPIYTGMLVGATGTALVLGEWRGLLAVGIMLAAHSWKASREEVLLSGEFGADYAEYRRRTGFLFPRLSRA
jgi:protein-S-isoprenylcysteine O-methyltransferase Ste14